MTTLLTSLPGDIPGLLRRGSPLLDCGHPVLCREVTSAPDGTVRSIRHDRAYHADGRVSSFVLDLTDPTGRWQAAVWVEQAPTYVDVMDALRNTEHVFYVEVIDAICRAKASQMMTPTQIDALARLVLRLAGRTA